MRELSPETEARFNNRFYAQRWLDNGKPLKVHRKIAVVNNFRYNAKYRNLICFFDTEYFQYDSKTGDEVPRPYDPRKDGILLEKISPIKSKNYLIYKYLYLKLVKKQNKQ